MSRHRTRHSCCAVSLRLESSTIEKKGTRMSQILQDARRRFMTNIRNPILRHNVAVLMGGKLLGLSSLLGLMWALMPDFAHAQGNQPADPTAQINAINTAWTLVAA